MLTTTIDIQKKSKRPTLQELLLLVRDGNEVLLTEGEQPIAKLTRVQSATTIRQPGLHAGAIRVADDFDEALPEDFWVGQG